MRKGEKVCYFNSRFLLNDANLNDVCQTTNKLVNEYYIPFTLQL